MERKHYVDNIRSLTIALVVVYHVFYSFNTLGIPTNIGQRGLGIPQAEVVCYALYPWFMVLMFLLAGVSASWSLERRDARAFRRERVRKLILPLVGGMFVIGWFNGWTTDHSIAGGMFGDAGAQMPAVVKYIIYSLSGMGPLWFLLELFVASMILLLLRRIDRRERFRSLCARAFSGRRGPALAALLVFAVWGSSFLLNTPLITTFRNGIYWFVFLLGYYVFSNEDLLRQLRAKKTGLLFLVGAVASGVLSVREFYGTDYTSAACLQSFIVNFFAWFTCLAFLSCGQRWLGGENRFSRFARADSFGLYVFHYPLLTAAAYFLVTRAPALGNPALYVILLVLIFPLTIGFTELVKRIPVLRTLLLGIGAR